MKNYLSIVPIFLFLISCNTGENGSVLLPTARGDNGEIILVVDPGLWATELGAEIKETFMIITPGLPRSQPLFSLRSVDPSKLNSVLKAAKNMIFITTLDGRSHTTQFYTESSLKQIKDRPDIFMESANDRFASGQEVLYLFNPTVEGLIQKITENRDLLRQHFNTVEKKRFISSLKKSTINKLARKTLNTKHKMDLVIPKSYEIAISEDDFMWFRMMTPDVDKNIIVTYKKYISEDNFNTDSLVAWRNRTMRKHVFGDPNDLETYVTTETKHADVTTKNISFNGDYAVEMRALWKTNKVSMGGPFLSYTFYNDENKLLYYIEGFVYSPGKSQREYMRELEAILATFTATTSSNGNN